MTKQTGMRLKQLRIRRGLTQKMLSKKSGVSESIISEFEKGNRKTSPSAATVYKLAKALSVDFEFFFNNTLPDRIIQKKHYYVHQNELIVKTPRFSNMENLKDFLIHKKDFDDFLFLPGFLNADFCFYMPDNSMAPFISKNDNVCIFKTKKQIETTPMLFFHGDTFFLRNLTRKGKSIVLKPINREYNSIVIDKRDLKEWQLIGMVLYVWRDVRNESGENVVLRNLNNSSSFREVVDNTPKTD